MTQFVLLIDAGTPRVVGPFLTEALAHRWAGLHEPGAEHTVLALDAPAGGFDYGRHARVPTPRPRFLCRVCGLAYAPTHTPAWRAGHPEHDWRPAEVDPALSPAIRVSLVPRLSDDEPFVSPSERAIEVRGETPPNLPSGLIASFTGTIYRFDIVPEMGPGLTLSPNPWRHFGALPVALHVPAPAGLQPVGFVESVKLHGEPGRPGRMRATGRLSVAALQDYAPAMFTTVLGVQGEVTGSPILNTSLVITNRESEAWELASVVLTETADQPGNHIYLTKIEEYP